MWKITVRPCKPFNTVAPFWVEYASSDEERDTILAASASRGDSARVEEISSLPTPRPPADPQPVRRTYEWASPFEDSGIPGAKSHTRSFVKPGI